MKTVSEMPHFDSEVEIGGKRINALDLRIERYPVELAKRRELHRIATTKGIVGAMKGQFYLFKPDGTIAKIQQSETEQFDQLPEFWSNYAVMEGKTGVPTLREVYGIGRPTR